MKAKTLLVILVAATGLALAQTNTKDKVADQIGEIIDTQEAKMTKFMEEVRALPREKQREAYQKGYPSLKKPTEALTAIIQKNPADPATLKAASWLLARGTNKPEIFDALEKHHIDNAKLSEVILSLARRTDEESKAFLAVVSQKSKAKDAQGAALYIQAMQMERDPAKADQYRAIVKKLNAKHADLEVRGRKVAAVMKATLEAKEKLAIGKQAPEIIGKDVDGNEMKLSDYKGKVVVLDFWGDW